MEPVSAIHGVLLELVAWRSQVGEMLESHGLGWMWRLLHYFTDAKTWVFCLLPVLLLQLVFPARRNETGHVAAFTLDWLYPVFSIAVASHFVVPAIAYVHFAGRAIWPEGPARVVGQWHPVVQFVLAFILQDLLRYVSHLLRHKIPLLWRFHAIHHSQQRLNPATTYRSHPLEALTSAALLALPMGVIGVDPVPWIYAGVTSLFWDFFIHSNVRTNLGFLGRFIVSPQFHRVHHSSLPEHVDRNFGERLVLWDWLFRTVVKDREAYPPTGCPESRILMPAAAGPFWPITTWVRHFTYPFRGLLSVRPPRRSGSRPARGRRVD
jgi:sterol desaturase/sphingolipid hydroxylase (fatty acid hydroxylase superfamily)